MALDIGQVLVRIVVVHSDPVRFGDVFQVYENGVTRDLAIRVVCFCYDFETIRRHFRSNLGW
jgi:hypothetical protein